MKYKVLLSSLPLITMSCAFAVPTDHNGAHYSMNSSKAINGHFDTKAKNLSYLIFSLDSDENIYLSNTSRHQIEKYSTFGSREWVFPEPENITPLGTAVNEQNNIYVVEHYYDYRTDEHQNYLKQLTTKGNVRTFVKINDNGNFVFDQVSVNKFGDIDLHGWEHYGREPYTSIERYNRNGDFQNDIASCASYNYQCELGKFVEDSNNNIITNNFGTHQLEKYSQFGVALSVLPLSNYEYNQSNVVSIDKYDDLLLINRNTGRLLVLDSLNGIMQNFTNYDFGRRNFMPIFASLKNNNVYVLSIKDWGNSYIYNIDKFDINGNFIRNVVTLYD